MTIRLVLIFAALFGLLFPCGAQGYPPDRTASPLTFEADLSPDGMGEWVFEDSSDETDEDRGTLGGQSDVIDEIDEEEASRSFGDGGLPDCGPAFGDRDADNPRSPLMPPENTGISDPGSEMSISHCLPEQVQDAGENERAQEELQVLFVNVCRILGGICAGASAIASGEGAILMVPLRPLGEMIAGMTAEAGSKNLVSGP